MNPVATETELTVFNSVEATLAEARAENENLVFNYDAPDGEKEARSHISKLRKVKTLIANVHKEAKAESRAFGLRLDAKKNEYTGEVDGMIKVHKDPLDAIAAEKQAIIDAEEAKAAEEEVKKQAELDAREQDVREKLQAIAEADEKLRQKQAELERKEREKKIAEEAAAKAKADAEAKAKADADAKELAEKKAKEAEEAANMKRIANKRHRQKIEGNIHETLKELGLDDDYATTVLDALKENKVPHVSINY